MGQKVDDKGGPSRWKRAGQFLVTTYETGGIPLVLIVSGAAMAFEAEFNFVPDGSSGLLRRDVYLIGIGLVLAGAVCWTFSVYMQQQRESERLRVLEAIVEAASKAKIPDDFFDSAGGFLSKVPLSWAMVADKGNGKALERKERPLRTCEESDTAQEDG